GESTWDEGLMLFLERSGFTEETYHTFSYSPVYDDDNRIAGMLCVVTEVTERVQSGRGLALLRDLSTRVAGTSVREALERLMPVLTPAGSAVLCAALSVVEDSRPGPVPLASCGTLPDPLTRTEFALGEGTLAQSSPRVIEQGDAPVVERGDPPPLVTSTLW